MAYAAVASLLQTMNLILNYHQDSISPKFKNQITCIWEYVIFLRSFLEDFPDEANALEERMRESTNIAKDVIELLLSDSTFGSSKSIKTGKHELSYDFDELEKVTEEIESIVREVKERNRETVDDVDTDVMEIISLLLGGSSGLEIVPIVGTGGIGKTTLARNVYDHPLITEHFDIRAWATVSVDYSWWGIILGLLSSMTETNAKSISNSDDKLFRSVYHLLWGRMYLIVLDDLWSAEVWEKLESKIVHNFNENRILITTRLQDMANGIKSNRHIHEMCLMNVDQSWNLLREKTFKGLPCPSKLECMGKMIARSCRGLPLTIEVVSELLAAHQTRAACVGGNYGKHEEDHKIRVSKLIKLWVAEGFMNESGSKSFEETGEEYLENLVKRSLVSVTKRRKNQERPLDQTMQLECRRNARDEELGFSNHESHAANAGSSGMKEDHREQSHIDTNISPQHSTRNHGGNSDNLQLGYMRTEVSNSRAYANDALYLNLSENPGMNLTADSFDGSNFHNWIRLIRRGLISRNKLSFVDGHICTCDALEDSNKDIEEEHMMGFFMGLIDSFEAIRQQILILDHLPNVSQTYAMVLQVGEQMNFVSTHFADPTDQNAMYANPRSSFKGEFYKKRLTRGEKAKLKCEHCGGNWHIKVDCFELVGVPDWYRKFKAERGQCRAYCALDQGLEGNLEQESPRMGVRTDSEMEHDMSKLVQSEIANHMATYFKQGIGTAARLNTTNLAEADLGKLSIDYTGHYAFGVGIGLQGSDWIINLGANSHMCCHIGMLSDLRRLKDPIQIFLPDGSTVWIFLIGTARLNEDLSLQNVLFAPAFTNNLLSIGQLTKDIN
ncbi:hypothetical protein C2S51_010114 [Perilla frutescens var. frutescens]|nr:hypothetical protein C2S51_010114 [Perilla frutescens var. frutescens]